MFSLSLSAQHRLTRTLSYTYLAVILVFAFFPLFWMLSSAIKPIEDLFVIPPQWIPQHPTLSTLNSVIVGDYDRPSLFPTYFKNSVIVTLGTTALALIVSTLAAYALSRYRFRGSGGLMMSILSIQMFPQGLILISLYLTFQSLQLLNTYPALIGGCSG